MTEIKKIKKISAANIVALLYALFGFTASFITSIYSLIVFVREKQLADKLSIYILTNLGLSFLIALAAAIAAGIAGWLLGFITAAFYNFLAKNIGGVKIELADETFDELKKDEEIKKSPFAKAAGDKQELFKY
ncbi:MAG: hypothetical protein PHO56_03685 [Patescibacteria group bacterium]|nr:hypothetical protein [Patescibacteria group bacterium]